MAQRNLFMKQNNLHVIVGLGATGLSCLRFLHAKKIPLAIMDTRANPPQLELMQQQYPDVPLKLGSLDEALLSRASTIILSPGLSNKEPLIAQQAARGAKVIGDIELFAQAAKAPIISITGTNAKSTVTTLVALMGTASGYRTQVGGNLGVPALDLLSDDINLYVLELSSFQLETTYSLSSKVASILNITPDHMDRYASLADYQAAKLRIYQHADVAVWNHDDPLTECPATIKQQFYFTLKTPGENEFGLVQQDGETHLAFGKQLLMPTKALPISGKHYQANALAALAIGYGAGFHLVPMLQVLREFKGLPHRCQFVRERDGVCWYNDSKGTNVGASQAAIEGLGAEIPGKLVLIAGGVGKNADFQPLLPAIEKYARHVVLIGEAATDLAQMIGDKIPVSFAVTMQEAIQQADDIAQPHDSVLLSPACASFDMFKNFEHRGQVFMEIVEKL